MFLTRVISCISRVLCLKLWEVKARPLPNIYAHSICAVAQRKGHFILFFIWFTEFATYRHSWASFYIWSLIERRSAGLIIHCFGSCLWVITISPSPACNYALRRCWVRWGGCLGESFTLCVFHSSNSTGHTRNSQVAVIYPPAYISIYSRPLSPQRPCSGLGFEQTTF